jgi:hypothetical protein
VLQFSVILALCFFFSDLRLTPDHERVDIVQISITDLNLFNGDRVGSQSGIRE